MMIGFKQEFVTTLKLMKKSKVTGKVSYVARAEMVEEFQPWPASTE